MSTLPQPNSASATVAETGVGPVDHGGFDDATRAAPVATDSDRSIRQSTPAVRNAASLELDAAPESVFPLPLTAFEQYAFIDDRADCPMTSWIELHFDALLDRDDFAAAVDWATHRHPLLAATVDDSTGQMLWQYDPEMSPTILDDQSTPPLSNGGGAGANPIDLRVTCGLRHWIVVNRDGGCVWRMQLHHAASDGMGLRRFLIDALDRYATLRNRDGGDGVPRQIGRSRRADKPPRVQDLVSRDDNSKSSMASATQKLSFGQRMKAALYFHFQPPASIGGKTSASTTFQTDHSNSSPCELVLLHRELSVEQSATILAAAKTGEGGVNELALTALMIACRQRLRRLGHTDPKTRLRLLMPIDLRQRSDLHMPAANRLSFSFVGRTIGQCDSTPDLLGGITREVQWIKRTRIYMDFLDGLESIRRFPRLLKRMTRRRASMATSVLTYSGDLARGLKRHFSSIDGRYQIGDVGLIRIALAPPTRPGTAVTFGMAINQDRLGISANWHRGEISKDDAEEVLDEFVTMLMKLSTGGLRHSADENPDGSNQWAAPSPDAFVKSF